MRVLTRRAKSAKALPPGRRGWPLLGETLEFSRDVWGFFDRRRRRYGPVFSTHLLGSPMVAAMGPEALRTVLVEQRERLSAGRGWPPALQALMGESLGLADGERHAALRRLLLPAFLGRALEAYLPIVEETVARALARWLTRGQLALHPEMKRLVFEVACQVILGGSPGPELESQEKLFEAYCRGFDGLGAALPIDRTWTPFGQAMAAKRELVHRVSRLVEERRRVPGTDALGRMVETIDEAGGGLSAHEVATHAVLLLFAGHESTASFLTSLCLELGRDLEIREQARREADEVAGAEPMTAAQLAALRYLDRVLLEVERRYPPFPGAFRYVEEDIELGGHTLPVGTRIYWSAVGTHQDERLYPDPDRFDPDRFAGVHAGELRRDCKLVGFGAGSKFCLGMELSRLVTKVVAVRLLRSADWRLVAGQDLSFRAMPSLVPRGGLLVELERRA
jgi:retinoid hydroxylase